MADIVNGNTQNGSVHLPSPSNQTHLGPAPIHDVKKSPNDRLVCLNQLLDKGHITVAPLREPELILHSHLPHVSSTFSTRGSRQTDQTLASWIGVWTRGWH